MNTVTEMPAAEEVATEEAVVSYRRPQEVALSAAGMAFVDEATTFEIHGEADNEWAAQRINAIRKAERDMEAQAKTVTKPLMEALEAARALFRPATAALAKAKGIYAEKIAEWDAAERKRLAMEDAARRERERKAREEIEARALKHMEAGREEKAETLIEQAALTEAPPVAPAAPKRAAGVAIVETWTGQCEDIKALARAVADGKVPPIAITANMTFVNAQAKSLKEHFNIPGCRAVMTRSARPTGK